MLDIIIRILSMLGIVLLILLIILLAALLLILFFPIFYRISAKKDTEKLLASVKADWLFGLLRVRYNYPEPGYIIVKLLWITLYDSGESKDVEAKQSMEKDIERTPEESVKTADRTTGETSNATVFSEEAPRKEEKQTFYKRIFAKFEKLKYTIRKIYAKIKHIVENITFYKRLLQDEETKKLLQHAYFRLGRILRSIRPRKLKGELLFGTGSPDTTGYALGVYGMLSPWMGKHMNITPDFTQSILEGKLYAVGHITVFTLLLHSLRLLMDKRLRLLRHRIKTHTI